MMALWRRGKPSELMHHSDQGSQYTSEDFQALLKDQGVTCSMSRRGDCWENAAMESFFSTLKTERVNRKVYRSRDEARADVFDYIERFYNQQRRHSRWTSSARSSLSRIYRANKGVRRIGGSPQLLLVDLTGTASKPWAPTMTCAAAATTRCRCIGHEHS